nr:DUF72 domain-containing protein [Myxococcota bacterium]
MPPPSGWVYPDGSGVFYPPGLPARDRLAHYAQHFDTVEINSTHYRLASERARATGQSVVPRDFHMVAKGSAFIPRAKRALPCAPSGASTPVELSSQRGGSRSESRPVRGRFGPPRDPRPSPPPRRIG